MADTGDSVGSVSTGGGGGPVRAARPVPAARRLDRRTAPSPISPPDAPYLIAFSMRLLSACASSWRWPLTVRSPRAR